MDNQIGEGNRKRSLPEVQRIVERNLGWRVNTPQFLQEIGSNPGMGILRQPLHIFADLLHSVGERAAELNDPRLNELMARLAIYAVADPYSPDFDEAITRELLTPHDQGTVVSGLPVAAYDAGGDVRIEAAKQCDGSTLWAVRNGPSCLAKDGQWEYEPMPSSRDDAFFERCRYPTAQAALDVLDAMRREQD